VRQGRIGDRYLICSDGLSDYVARDTIDEVLLGVSDPGECADRLVALALRAGAPDNVTVVVGDLVEIGRRGAPSTVPEVVGAAAARRGGTRPIPTTPAAKAAALTKSATGAPDDDDTDDHVTLAEEGPRSRRAVVLRLAALLLVTGVVLAGGSYAAYAWSQQQYYLAASDGIVSVYRGVDQTLGPVALSQEEYSTTIAVADLPQSYQASLERGIEAGSRTDADARVSDLRVQAVACRWAKANGETCQTVPYTWTPPSPSPSPSPSTTQSPTVSPSPSGSTAPTSATPGRSRAPVTPLPPTTQAPVTS
jgi:protein phosphatase